MRVPIAHIPTDQDCVDEAVAYDAWFRREVALGLAEADDGKLIPHHQETRPGTLVEWHRNGAFPDYSRLAVIFPLTDCVTGVFEVTNEAQAICR
jgi:hypothetical protein